MKQACDIALEAQRLNVCLGHAASRPAVRDVSLRIRAGRWTSVVGPNGAGKSTLVRALAGLLPCRGDLGLMGRSLSDWSLKERARAIGWLAQGGANETGADDLTVYDVALLGRLPHQGWLAPPSALDHVVTESALRQMHAWDWRERALGSLSGGERQRVLLARLLAVDAPVMLMDEPLANLDPPHQADWIDMVRAQVSQGRTVVSVLHEVSVALLADDLVVMRDGCVSFAGDAATTEAHQSLVDVFDGRISIHRLEGRWVALPR